jgi:hypothetical protein
MEQMYKFKAALIKDPLERLEFELESEIKVQDIIHKLGKQ